MVKAGLNLKILDNSKEQTVGQGFVTLKSNDSVAIDSGILAFNYVLAAGKSDTGFTVNIYGLLNPDTFTSTDQFSFTDEILAGSVYSIQPYERTIVANTTSGEFLFKVNFPAPIQYIIVKITWTGSFTVLSDLTVNYLPNCFKQFKLPF